MANIIDKPILDDSKDKLGAKEYKNALLEFIKTSDTPMTISIQGEWGSGKTSFMNMLQYELELESDLEKKYPTIRINTWEYSILTEDNIPINIISSIVSKLINKLHDERGNWKDTRRKYQESVVKILGGLVKGGVKIGLQYFSEISNNEAIDDATSYVAPSDLTALKKELKSIINEITDFKKSDKIVFFIDDLDRLQPEVAINILEILKNIFDIDKCLFVLAIDYEVVIKGLASKFGEKDKNEREYRQFFDKIIQLPFTIPTNSYKTDDYIKNIFIDQLKFFNSNELNDDNLKYLSNTIKYTVNGNPRAIKRVANYLSLINCLKSVKNFNKEKKLIIVTIVSIQVCYPFLFDLIIQNSDYKNWDEDFLKEQNIIINSENDDELISQLIKSTNNNFFIERTFDIIGILNLISKQFGSDYFKKIDEVLELTSITNVSVKKKVSSTDMDFVPIWKELHSKFNEIDPSKTFRSQTILLKDSNAKIKITITKNYSKIEYKISITKNNKLWDPLYSEFKNLENFEEESSKLDTTNKIFKFEISYGELEVNSCISSISAAYSEIIKIHKNCHKTT